MPYTVVIEQLDYLQACINSSKSFKMIKKIKTYYFKWVCSSLNYPLYVVQEVVLIVCRINTQSRHAGLDPASRRL